MNESNEQSTSQTLGTSLLKVIGRSDLPDLATDIGELGIDELLENGLLKDVPFLGGILKLAKFGISVSNYLFLEKISKFLSNLKDIPVEQRARFIQELEQDEEFRQRVGENLLLLLHRLDDVDKPELLGRAFRAYVEGRIEYPTYQKLATAIDRIKIYNIDGLKKFYDESPDREPPDDETLQDLAFCGLVSLNVVKGLTFGPMEGFEKNEIGKVFMKIVLED
ncbi:MAG TPA: hypothetical protein VE130_14115 [Nitrososphaeraceae archaeon]|nr:hypothetical protein [Nitrososphaeraceae archaeon]